MNSHCKERKYHNKKNAEKAVDGEGEDNLLLCLLMMKIKKDK